LRFEGADDASAAFVEEIALQHYASDEGGNFDGIHSESSVFTTLFVLILWQAMFDVTVPDVFRTSLQTAPLDLGHPGFYECRSNEIEEILSLVEGGQAPRLIQHTWDAHHGTLARGIAGTWDSWDVSTLQCIATCIGGKGLAAICRILAREYATMCSGMPDLLLWNAERGVAKLSEVKSTNDVLSDKQRVWINELERAGVDVEVCRVIVGGFDDPRPLKRPRT
jgi:Fanconi-associated nuclease 1